MWNERTVADRLRRAARSQLPDHAFLRRDRGDALYVTNAPIGRMDGFSAEDRGGIRALYPDDAWIAELEAAATPRDHFSAGVRRFRNQPILSESRALFIRGVKLLEDRPSDDEITRFDQAARSLAAVALRTGAGGGVYAVSILNNLLQTRREERR